MTFGKLVLADFPPELQKELKEEDWSDNEDGDIPNIFDSRLEGKDWTDCLEKTFVRLELLKLGYEICWECKEYRNDHREFFEKYFETMEELFGSGDDEGDKDDDIGSIWTISKSFSARRRKAPTTMMTISSSLSDLGCVVNRFVLYYANVKKGYRENGECIRTT